MALFFSHLGNILTVRQEIYSFTDTKVTFVRYNLDLWISQVDNDPWQECTTQDIEWVKTHYLPKVEAKDGEQVSP